MKVPLVPTEYSDFLTDPNEKISAKTTEDPFAQSGIKARVPDFQTLRGSRRVVSNICRLAAFK